MNSLKAAIQTNKKTIKGKEKEIAGKEKLIAEKEKIIAEKEKLIADFRSVIKHKMGGSSNLSTLEEGGNSMPVLEEQVTEINRQVTVMYHQVTLLMEECASVRRDMEPHKVAIYQYELTIDSIQNPPQGLSSPTFTCLISDSCFWHCCCSVPPRETAGSPFD